MVDLGVGHAVFEQVRFQFLGHDRRTAAQELISGQGFVQMPIHEISCDEAGLPHCHTDGQALDKHQANSHVACDVDPEPGVSSQTGTEKNTGDHDR